MGLKDHDEMLETGEDLRLEQQHGQLTYRKVKQGDSVSPRVGF